MLRRRLKDRPGPQLGYAAAAGAVAAAVGRLAMYDMVRGGKGGYGLVEVVGRASPWGQC